MLFSVGETSCECNRLYNELKGTRTEMNYEDIFSEICESGIGMILPGCPLFLESQLENRLKLYDMIGETPPEQVTPEPYNVNPCPLCVILDHGEHNQEHRRQNWLEIVENIWKNELSLSNFCFRCLRRLNVNGIGSSCEKWEGYSRNSCQKPDCLMKDPKLWKYHIISNVHSHLACIMGDGCLHQSFSCQLKKIRLELSAMEAYEALSKINLRENSKEELNLILKNVDDAFEQLKNRKTIYEAEELKDMDLEDSFENMDSDSDSDYVEDHYMHYIRKTRYMEEMAEYSLKEEVLGCPMVFDHGIVLNPIVLKELENMDLDSDTDFDSDPVSCYGNYLYF
ncbi:hypothetical protein CAEBREN_03889 [Caenorhabditis brenneri]|uniref:Uncharacterized protein n=1 Tax=Caenorhabditis brenneri TaxID=135651 RepID=G0P5A4_CAEBE|nr:hypothetical protein CAEBREN_03889 [Caenorhabditis brenneri]